MTLALVRSRPHGSRGVRRLTATVLVVGVFVAAACQSPAVRHQLALSFTRLPTPYTELYFTDHQDLPRRLAMSHPNTFSFTVVNHEGRKRTYPYVVTTAGGPRSTTVVRGAAVVPSGRAVSEIVPIIPLRAHGHWLVSVQVFGPRVERLHFTASS